MKKHSQVLCPSCEKGHLSPKIADYTAELPDGIQLIVSKVKLDVCDHCGEIAIPMETARQIDAAIAEKNEQLTPRELERIREDLNVDQTEMSEVLGLGSKTYHRWEKGTQIPSRSMCRYLRILAEFPDAFDWLRNHRWRLKNRLVTPPVNIDFSVAFPDLTPNRDLFNLPIGLRFNPARALFG